MVNLITIFVGSMKVQLFEFIIDKSKDFKVNHQAAFSIVSCFVYRMDGHHV